LPFKDLEARRDYDRRYKRKLRAGMSNPDQSKVRAYLCFRSPQLRLAGGVCFRDGLYVTENPTEQKVIEDSQDFGHHIFRLKILFHQNG
jgi:hypothetical protein